MFGLAVYTAAAHGGYLGSIPSLDSHFTFLLCVWIPATLVGDLDGIPSSWLLLWPVPPLAIVGIKLDGRWE